MNENPNGPEELASADDAVIGTALRRSAFAVLTLGTAVAVAWWLLRPDAPKSETRVTALAAPQAATVSAEVHVPTVPFTDVTADSGIDFRHQTGATGEKLLPETMGGGVAFVDLDADGDPDLLFVNGTAWPWDTPSGGHHPGHGLFRNDSANGRIRFTDVSAASGLDGRFYGMGVAVGDYDNDGLPDLLLTGVGGARLHRNLGGLRFADVTADAGVGGDPADWTSAATWFDFDRDGDLDLFVASYVRWSREIDAEVGYKIDGETRAYGPPMNFEGAFPRLYRNEGGGRFTDISEAAGVQVRNPATGRPAAKTLGTSAVDLNGDGWPDLVAANDTVQNFVFLNRRDGTFREIGAETGIAFDSYGNTRGAMGIDTARLEPGGRLAFAIGNFANEMTALYVEQAASSPDLPLFSDEALAWSIGGPSRDPLKFGVFFFDYDLDGRPDLLTVNGHLEEEISKIQHGQRYEQSPQLFWNGGAAGFLPVTPTEAGSDLFRPLVGRGSAFADVDGDGDLDVVATSLGGQPRLWRNDRPGDRCAVRLRLAGTVSNRDAQGAWVRARVADADQWWHVTTTRSYLSASELPVTLGLGTAPAATEIEIRWPSGRTTLLKDVPPGTLTVEEPRGETP